MKEQIIKILESYIVDNIGETSPKIDVEAIHTIADEILALQLQQTGVSGNYFAVCYSTNEGLFFVDEEDNQTKSQGNAKKFKSVKEAEMYINKELCGFGNVIPL